MERIKNLVRMTVLIALTMLMCTFLPWWYGKQTMQATVYAQFCADMERFQEQLAPSVDTLFMREAEFTREWTMDALDAHIEAWLKQLNAQGDISELKQALKAYYQAQRELLEHPEYDRYVWSVRIITGILVILAGAIWLVAKQKERLLERELSLYHEEESVDG